MEWSRLVALVQQVRGTARKGEKTALIADLLRETRGRDSELAAHYLTGTLPQGRIGVGWRTIEPAVPSGPPVGPPLTLAALDEALAAIAADTGAGSVERRLRRRQTAGAFSGRRARCTGVSAPPADSVETSCS